MKSRAGIKDRSDQYAFAEESLLNGVRVIDMQECELRDRLTQKLHSKTRMKNAYFYNGYLCIFRNKEMITMYYVGGTYDYGK